MGQMQRIQHLTKQEIMGQMQKIQHLTKTSNHGSNTTDSTLLVCLCIGDYSAASSLGCI
jgi:hypothetical protein